MEADTCISSKLEEIIDDKYDKKGKEEIDEDMKRLNRKLDTLMEKNNLRRVKEYVNESTEIKNLFPYEQKKLRRDENEMNEINKINEIKNDRMF